MTPEGLGVIQSNQNAEAPADRQKPRWRDAINNKKGC